MFKALIVFIHMFFAASFCAELPSLSSDQQTPKASADLLNKAARQFPQVPADLLRLLEEVPPPVSPSGLQDPGEQTRRSEKALATTTFFSRDFARLLTGQPYIVKLPSAMHIIPDIPGVSLEVLDAQGTTIGNLLIALTTDITTTPLSAMLRDAQTCNALILAQKIKGYGQSPTYPWSDRAQLLCRHTQTGEAKLLINLDLNAVAEEYRKAHQVPTDR